LRNSEKSFLTVSRLEHVHGAAG